MFTLSGLKFTTIREALIEAGVESKSGRGAWGGVTPDGEIVVTGWLDQRVGDDAFRDLAAAYPPWRSEGPIRAGEVDSR